MSPRSPRSSSSLLATALAAAAGAPAARAAAIADPARTRAIVLQVLKDHRYQTTMPRPGGETGEWWFHLPLLALPKLLAWLLAIVVVVLLALWIVDALRRRAESGGAAGAAAPGAAAVAIELAQAERLAAEARFAEAAHLLLLLAIQHLARRPGAAVPAASTSREIVRGLTRSLLPEQREALAELVGRVEVSWFGGRPLDPGGYARCRECCRVVTGAA